MRKRRLEPPTSVRLDEFQLAGLVQMQQRMDRSRSWLISRAVDRMLEEELQLSRAEHEAQARAEADARLLAEFTPKPFRMVDEDQLMLSELVESVPSPVSADEVDPDDALDARIQALLEEHGGEAGQVATWSAREGLRSSSKVGD